MHIAERTHRTTSWKRLQALLTIDNNRPGWYFAQSHARRCSRTFRHGANGAPRRTTDNRAKPAPPEARDIMRRAMGERLFAGLQASLLECWKAVSPLAKSEAERRSLDAK